MPYKFPELRQAILPNPDSIMSMLQKADNDDNSRDIRPLAATCKRLLSANLRLAGHLKIRKTAITSFGWSLTAIESADAKYAERATKSLRRGITGILENHVRTEAFGCMALQTKWGFIDEQQLIAVTPIDPTLAEQKGASVTILADSNMVKRLQTVSPDDYNPNFIVQCDTDAFENGGLLRGILPVEAIRRAMIVENANFLTKLKGILQIIDKGGAGSQQSGAAEQAAKTVNRHNVIVTNDLLELKLNEITGSGGGFKELVEMLNSEISIAVLGQANTTQLPNSGGSRAALQVQKMISADIHYSDIIRTERIVNEQLLPIYWQLNQDKSATETPLKFSINLFEEEDTEKNALAVREAREAGLEVNEDELYKKLGFKNPNKSGAVVKLSASGGVF